MTQLRVEGKTRRSNDVQPDGVFESALDATVKRNISKKKQKSYFCWSTHTVLAMMIAWSCKLFIRFAPSRSI